MNVNGSHAITEELVRTELMITYVSVSKDMKEKTVKQVTLHSS